MSVPEAAQDDTYGSRRLASPAHPAALDDPSASVAGAVAWAFVASTTHRLRRGEGALLAVNLSLVVQHGAQRAHALAEAVVSVLTIALMYAFNDLLDAPTDWNNPKKDRALIATYLEERTAAGVAMVVLKVATGVLALVTLGPWSAVAVTAVMLVNVVYSTMLKGVPVADVAWCGVWGAVYVAIVSTSPIVLLVVGLMTAVCHLYQALDDRLPDAEVGIETTAVRSPALARNVLAILSLFLFVALYAPFGLAGALTAFIPLAIFFAVRNPGTGWVLTKMYFGAMWLCLLGLAGAAG